MPNKILEKNQIENKKQSVPWQLRMVSLIALIILSLPLQVVAEAPIQYGYVSWYSEKSCQREGTSGIMANGEVFNDKELVAASWDYPFNTKLKVTNMETEKEVIVTVKDRGPAKKLYNQGRILDISRSAFNLIARLSSGVVYCKIEVVNE